MVHLTHQGWRAAAEFGAILMGEFDLVTQGFVLAGAWLQLLALLLLLGWFLVRRGSG